MDKLLFFAVVMVILTIIGVIFGTLLSLKADKEYKEAHPKSVEVCEGVEIATLNANEDICFAGCIEYKGQFVPYATLKYLQEECTKRENATM
jgi:hypothetical protein